MAPKITKNHAIGYDVKQGMAKKYRELKKKGLISKFTSKKRKRKMNGWTVYDFTIYWT